MEYRPVRPEGYEAVRSFLAKLGWDRRVSDPERFRKMLENADRTIVAVDDDRIVGFARALCDGVSNGYISMVAVVPDRRGEDIGSQLVHRLIGDDPHITWVLRAGRDSFGFWQKLGSLLSQIAMEKTRTMD